MKKLMSLSFAIFLTAMLGGGVAAAGDFDGSKRLLCSPGEAMECAPTRGCERVSLEAARIPHFFSIDFKKKRLTGKGPGSEERTTVIQNVEKSEGRMILQGAENGRGWSIDIHQDTGRMAASVADEQAVFSLFGACTASK